MISFDDYVNEKKTVLELHSHNLKWPDSPDHPYRILIIGSSGSGKTKELSTLAINQLDIDKIYLYAKDPCEAKYQYLIKKKRKHRIKSI